MLNAYDGFLNINTDVETIQKEIAKLIINNDMDRAYELHITEDIKVVCLIGNEDEKDIPPFTHPMYYTDYNGTDILAVDFRLYMKSNVTDIDSVFDNFSNNYQGRLLLYTALFNILLVTEPNIFKGIEGNIAYSLSAVVAGVITKSTFDNSVTDPVLLATQIHYVTLDLKHIDAKYVIDRLPVDTAKEASRGNLYRTYQEFVSKADKGELTIPSTNINTLVELIKILSNNTRLDNYSSDILISLLNKSFYSLNMNEMVISMFEYKPVWIAILFMVNSEHINKKSTMHAMIKGLNRRTNMNGVTKTLDSIISNKLKIY